MDSGRRCDRECKPGDRRVCHFYFMMKYFQVMGGACANCTKGDVDGCLDSKCVLADGVGRGFLSINFRLPGPPINVCKGDVIVIDLTNEGQGTSTAIHWHGIRQFNTQFMDGVPYVTQCPIPFGAKFRYAFHAEDEGTHFYHSHAGHQKANGIFGSLIVRGPREQNPNSYLYDYDLKEHVIIVSDWMHHLAEEDFPGVVSRSVLTESILINGHGRYYNTTSESYTFAPWPLFNVDANKRYRFRFINSGFNVCPFMLQIESHEMIIIASEVSNVHPMTIDSLYSLPGERFDFVVNADQPPRDYWIRVQTLNPCRTVVETFGILRYGEDHQMSIGTRVSFTANLPPRLSTEFPTKKFFNSPMPKVKDIPLISLKAYNSDRSIIDNPPNHKFYLFLDSPTILDHTMDENGNYFRLDFETSRTDFNSIGTFNNISLKYPTFPLLTQPELINDSMFCNENSTVGKHCFDNKFLTACRCVHRIKVKFNSIVELVVVNVDDQIAHPVHLHGHKFHVLDMGVFEKKPIPGVIRRNGIPMTIHKNPPFKDTVILPFPGYVRLRFRANNPGFWLFHCHFDWHLETGMAVIFQVGELSDMKHIKIPTNFPKCSEFSIDEID
ncbi:CLUMA_CG014215, isoform A [Clunio marinus]|uniref:CLUMA_CG014215, isoform A n=1 Tax=Clunio marinus TaxID=568069 RepID=A0A1J1IR85_9DIPT|nr:CLUMA_CG014215, isoform A [Clunio marinus]